MEFYGKADIVGFRICYSPTKFDDQNPWNHFILCALPLILGSEKTKKRLEIFSIDSRYRI